MTTLKQGDLIKDSDGYERKVLEVCGTILFISQTANIESYELTANEESLKENGFTWDTPVWKATYGEQYWYINERGEADLCIWRNDHIDNARRDFLGIYQTKELCEAALLEIRRKLGK